MTGEFADLALTAEEWLRRWRWEWFMEEHMRSVILARVQDPWAFVRITGA